MQGRAPSGQFVHDADLNALPLFIAGGVGITPILSMLKAAPAERPDRVAHLFNGVRNRRDHAFKAVLSQLAKDHPGFDLHVLHADPAPEDVPGQNHDLVGFVGPDQLRQLLPHGRHAFYLCGPDPMMQALIPCLEGWGVDGADIHRGSFGPQAAEPRQPKTASGPTFATGFRRSGRTLDWTGQDASLPDFAERHSVRIYSGCRTGMCGKCETRVISGSEVYAKRPEHAIAPGHCLPCVCTPATVPELVV